MEIKHRLRGFVALAMSFMTVLNTPMMSLAVGSNTSSGNQAGVVGGRGSDLGANRPNSRIGFRVSLVNKDNLTEVLSCNNDGKTQVVDFLFMSEENFQHYTGYTTGMEPTGGKGYRTNITYVGAGSRLQSWNERNKLKILPEEWYLSALDLPQVPQWCKSTGNVLYGGNGTEFENWFISDPEGNTQVGGASGDLFSVSGGVVKQHVGTRLDVTTSYKDTDGNPISFSVTVPAFKTRDDVSAWLDQYSVDWGPMMDEFIEKKTGVKVNSLDTKEKIALYQEYTESVKKALNDAAKTNDTLSNYIETINQQLDAQLKKAQKNLDHIQSSLLDKFNPFKALNVYADTTTENKVMEGGATTPDGGYVGVKVTEIYKELPSNAKIKLLLTMKDSNTKTGYLFQTKSTLDAFNKNGKQVDILSNECTEDWICFVEPLFFCSMFPVGDDSRVLCNKFYGTLTNFYDWIHETKADGHLTDNQLNKVNSTMNWKFYNSAGSYGSLKLNADIPIGNGETLKAPKDAVPATASFNQLYDLLIKNKMGYAIHAYDKHSISESSSTTTWDYKNHPNDIGPSPDEKESKEDNWNLTSTTGQNLDKKFIISKFYYLKNPWGDLTLTDVQTREDTLHSVLITDEGTKDSEFAYRVKGWAAGKDKVYPQTDDLSEGFNDYTKKNRPADPNHQGNGQDKLVLDPTNEKDRSEQVLYVMLVREEIINTSLDIVRVYERKDGTSEVEVETGVNVDKSLDGSSKKTGFDFEESKTTSEIRKEVKNWDEVKPLTGETGNTPTIPVKETDKTVYIKYKEVGGPTTVTGQSGLVLHENELTHQFQLENVDGTLHNTVRSYAGVEAPSHGKHYCGGCEEDSDGDSYCPGHSCSASFNGVTDYTFGLLNDKEYSTEKVWKWAHIDSTINYSGDGHGTGSFSVDAYPNMQFILSRSSTDKPTIYPKNENDRSVLNGMGYTAEGYIPTNKRNGNTKDQDIRKTWTDTFNTNWTFAGIIDPVASWTMSYCGETISKTKTSSGDTAALNSLYSQPGNVQIFGLWGKANTGEKAPSNKPEQFMVQGVTASVNKMMNTKSNSEGYIQYYPYYKMKYVNELGQGEQNAYFTSENLSKLLNINMVDVSVAQGKAGIPLELSSTQWSIHKGAQDLLYMKGIKDKDSLLPTGAIYSLKVADGNSMWLKFRTYQTVVDDADVNKLDTGSSKKTLSKAQENSKTFREQVRKSLDNYEVVLLGSEDFSDDTKVRGEWNQITGAAKKNQFFSSKTKLAGDDKYKLEANTGKANASDLDILGEPENTVVWKFTSDADGNVKIFKNGTEVSSINKTQGASALWSGKTDIEELNRRTSVVENFVNSIDRNKGSDRAGNTWYNEGFESIIVYEHDFAFNVGFGSSNPVRSAALNITLNGYLENRQHMFDTTDTAKTARTFQFRTSKKSVLPEAQSKPDGWVGTFGDAQDKQFDVVVPQMDSLFTSKLFYTSNTTVMDGN